MGIQVGMKNTVVVKCTNSLANIFPVICFQGMMLEFLAKWSDIGNENGDDVSTVKQALRSEERRVGKECRSRGSPYH